MICFSVLYESQRESTPTAPSHGAAGRQDREAHHLRRNRRHRACLTEQALAAGHEVTAVVRDPARLTVAAHPLLRVVTADVMDPAAILPAVAGADAVLTAVGPRGTGPTTVIQDSARSIVAAMQKSGSAPAADAQRIDRRRRRRESLLRYLIKPLARRTFLRHVCADMRAAEAEVRDQRPGLDDRPAAAADQQASRQVATGPRSTATCRAASASRVPTWLLACWRWSTTRRASRSTSGVAS